MGARDGGVKRRCDILTNFVEDLEYLTYVERECGQWKSHRQHQEGNHPSKGEKDATVRHKHIIRRAMGLFQRSCVCVFASLCARLCMCVLALAVCLPVSVVLARLPLSACCLPSLSLLRTCLSVSLPACLLFSVYVRVCCVHLLRVLGCVYDCANDMLTVSLALTLAQAPTRKRSVGGLDTCRCYIMSVPRGSTAARSEPTRRTASTATLRRKLQRLQALHRRHQPNSQTDRLHRLDVLETKILENK